jgi:Tol biopolymer transport system component
VSAPAALRGALAAAALACAASAGAQPYDPAFRWRTLETPHFRVHHHQGEELLAQDVAREAERARARLAPRLGWAPPGRTEIVLSDDVDDANGSATPLPYNTIRLYAVPPSSGSVLQDYRDWLRQLVQHEYVHVLHLDRVGGFPAAFNALFGKLWVPNGFTPALLAEGLAVVNESEDDPAAGRNASALFDMYARALALDGPFPDLDDAVNPFLEWPVGNVPYLLGGRFVGYLQARYGAASLAAFVADQGTAIWPWAPSTAGRRWFGGKDFPTLWREYGDAERAYAEGRRAAVRARPVTVPAPLTRRGGFAEGPRFSPDGRFVAYHSRTLDERPGLRRVALDGTDLGHAATVESNGALALRSPREALVAIGEVHREFRVYDDLWLVDLEGGGRRRVTRGERATDPDLAPDGRAAVYVRRDGGGATSLVRRALDGGEAEVLFAHRGAEVFRPRVARDGRVAFELHEGGRRDLAVWRDGRVERVTDDDALDTGPAWTPDGRFLLFASDRGGLFNLYAWEAATGAIRQVTNVELGALQPDVSPDGRTIVFATYSRAGFDLATIPFDEGSWMEATSTETSTPTPSPTPTSTSTPSPSPSPTSTSTSTATATPTATPTPTSTATPATEYPSRPYSPWSTVRPTFWLPIVSADDAGPTFGALTGGMDVLVRHTWIASGWWSADGGEPGYAVAYQGGWSWPRLDLSSSLALEESRGPPYRLQRVWTLADAGLGFTWTRLSRALALRVGWSGTRYDTVGPALPAAPVPEAIRFEDGLLSEASLTARYSDARRFVRSISPEEGRTAVALASVAAPELGSDYSVARARANVAQYLRLPFTRHAVLALRAAGGVAEGSIGGDPPFELGGFGDPDPLALVPGAIASPPDQLRGYEHGALGGTGYVLGNLELRFPLGAPGLGRSTWPLFLRRVHGALFADAGDAFDLPGELAFAGHRLDLEQLRFSAGAELRLEVVLGYALRTDVRVGVARALGRVLLRDRAGDFTAYVAVGPSF